MRDENQIAFGILRTLTLTEPRPGESSKQRMNRANALEGGKASAEKVPADQRKANGLKGAIARWGTVRERDNHPAMPKKDLNQLAYSILQQATGEAPKPKESAKAKAGRAGGVKGGATRAANLAPVG